MLAVACLFTAILLAITIPLAFLDRRYGSVWWAALALTVGGSFLTGLLVVFCTGFLVCILALGVWREQTRPWAFSIAALVCSAISYLLAWFIMIPLDADGEGNRARLRQEYPVESLEDRLAYQTPARLARAQGDRPAQLPHEALERLTRLESSIEGQGAFRTMMLHRLHTMHKGTLERFIDSPGFGVSRRILPTEERLQLREDELPDVELPVGDEYLSTIQSGPNPPSPPDTKLPDRAGLLQLHTDSIVDFAHSKGFGWAPEHKRVAGFRPHRMKDLPQQRELDESNWKVLRVELVSLLKADTPGVYLSRHLPRMDELRDARTRPLDEFERDALPSLQVGEDLVSARSNGHLRVLGSIRAGESCLKCHDAQRGDLLGAFTYALKREGK